MSIFQISNSVESAVLALVNSCERLSCSLSDTDGSGSAASFATTEVAAIAGASGSSSATSIVDGRCPKLNPILMANTSAAAMATAGAVHRHPIRK